MKIDDMTIHMFALRAAYPNAWPKELPTETIMATWYDNFQHVSNDLFSAAVKHAIATYEWPSIKDMWESILTVAGVPSLFDVQESFRRMQARWHNPKEPVYAMESHPLVKKTIEAMGYPDDIAAMGSYVNKQLKDLFETNREAYRSRIIKPSGAQFLESSYRNLNQLTKGRTGQITE